MRIDMRSDEVLTLYIDGKLALEACVGTIQTREHLEEEINRARLATNAMRFLHSFAVHTRNPATIKDHVNTTPEKKKQALLRGFLDGLAARVVPHPMATVPPIPPEHSPCYRAGYDDGYALKRAMSLDEQYTRKESTP